MKTGERLGARDWSDQVGPTAPRDAIELLAAAIRVILLLAAVAGFVDRSGVASPLWSVFVGAR